LKVILKTNRLLLIFILAVFWNAFSYKVYAGDVGIRWQTYTAGMKMASERNLPVFLHFFADWCKYCAKMEKETFQEKSVIEYLNNNYVAIKVDFDNEKKITREYRVMALPVTFVIGLDGNRTGPLRGFVSKEELLQVLKQIQ
jgi:thiol:disulfide interchange protein